MLMPQFPERVPGKSDRVQSFRCQERYGYAWVALEEPLCDIPAFPEAETGTFIVVHEFYEPWDVAGLRVMENELDMAHPGFVHLGTFGSPDHLLPVDIVVKETDFGLHYSSRIGVSTAHHAHETANERLFDCTWFAPFGLRLRINYADGGPPHVIGNFQVPISNGRTQFVQFCMIEQNRGIDPEQSGGLRPRRHSRRQACSGVLLIPTCHSIHVSNGTWPRTNQASSCVVSSSGSSSGRSAASRPSRRGEEVNLPADSNLDRSSLDGLSDRSSSQFKNGIIHFVTSGAECETVQCTRCEVFCAPARSWRLCSWRRRSRLPPSLPPLSPSRSRPRRRACRSSTRSPAPAPRRGPGRPA